MSKLKIAIIGCGGMGGHHLRMMRLSKLFEVVGVLDIDRSKQQLCDRQGIKFFSSFEELAAYPELEAVLIATPNDSHYSYVLSAANAGLNVICEKPATITSELYEKMIAAANDNKVILTIHQNRRWDRDFLCMEKVVQSGAIGRVYNIESRVLGSHGVPGAWRKVKAQGGGMVFDWGVHLIDQLLYFKNDCKVTAVYCRCSYACGLEVDDGFSLELDFSDGTHATVVIDTNSFQKLPRWMIYGENGTSVVKDWNRRGNTILVRERVDKNLKGIRAGNGFTKTMADRTKSTIVRMRLPRTTDQRFAFYQNFFNAVRSGEEQIVKNDEVLRVLKVIEAAFLSDETKQVIKTEI